MGFRLSHFTPIYRNTHLTRRIPSSSSPSHSCPTKCRLVGSLSPINPLTDQPLPPLIFPKQPHHYIPIRTHFGHPHRSGHEPEYILKLGLASDIALSVAKGLAGYLSGSTAIIADAAHSVSDIVLSGVAWVSFRVARAPKDEEHPYGHGKFETLGALGISGMLLATAGGIGWHALDILMGLALPNSEVVNHSVLNGHVHQHHHGIDMDHPILALNVMIISIAVKEGLYWITKKAGEKQGSGLMMANAWHHRADAVSSVVALIGVGGSILGVKFLDPLAGLYVSVLILKAGIGTGYQSIMELVDAGVPMALLDPIKQTILQVDGVMGCHRIRGRRAGSSVYLDVHIEVDPFSSVSAAHDIGENVRRDIQKSHAEVAEVFIHIDPSLSQLSPRLTKDQAESRTSGDTSDVISHQKDVEVIVSEVLSSKFPMVVSVERITHHSLQGKLILQIEVSMPPDMLIQEAMHVAKEAEKEILKAASNLTGVSIQLRLGNSIPHFHQKM